MKNILVLAMVTLIAGCARTPVVTAGPDINMSGFPQEFRQGYADGCSSSRGIRTRNESRFGYDAQYAAGWYDGRDICSRR